MIPFIRYHDAKAAIDFLVDAFGFESKMVVEHEDVIVHAQLAHGNGLLMLSDSRGEEALVAPVADGSTPTAGVYVVIDDADAHAARAESAGATIVWAPADQDYGGREYTCLDPEGNVWSFGTYDPWSD